MRFLIFPAAVMMNAFSMMVLTIGLSLFGKPEVAAEIGLVHGATVALFYSFSGNARSLILSSSVEIDSARILRLRLVLLLPLSISAWLLCAGVVEGDSLFISILIMRRAAEWLAEVFLSEHELHHQFEKSLCFFLVQGVGLVVILIALIVDVWVVPVVLIWACTPLLSCVGKEVVFRAFYPSSSLLGIVRLLLPHFGSTLAIGVSVYVFRLFIVLLVGKQEAGDLFAAFALGGILGAVFSQALGPTMIRHEQRQSASGSGRLGVLFNFLLISVLLAGCMLALCVWRTPDLLLWTSKSSLFWLAVSCSLIGGVLMVLAQGVRLRLLQGGAGRDVFGSDVLANLLLIGCVPLFYFVGGEKFLAALYLVGALLSLAFYISEDWVGVMQSYQRNFLVRSVQGSLGAGGKWQQSLGLLLAAGLFAPVFIQLSGGLYQGGAHFRSGGNFMLLPIPLSVLFCYMGIVLFGGYARARIALIVIFFTFIGMLMSVLLLGEVGGGERAKLILLVQYALPMFALIFGVQFGCSDDALGRMAKILLKMLLIIVLLQVVSTFFLGGRRLSSSAIFFGVYQHLQYVPVIFSGAFLVSLYSLWGDKSYHVLLMGLAGLMGVYTAISVSVLALLLLLGGVVIFALRNFMLAAHRVRSIILTVLVVVGVGLGFLYLTNSGLVAAKFGFLMSVGGGASVVQEGPENLAERIVFWSFYFDGVRESWQAFLFGHVQAPDRGKFPSAHNYYLDFVYNFGVIAMLPLLGLILFTCYKILKNFNRVFFDSGILGVAGVVVFILLIDNFFKVGMRQPYPGIISFFLWGVLLAGLSQLSSPKVMQDAERKNLN